MNDENPLLDDVWLPERWFFFFVLILLGYDFCSLDSGVCSWMCLWSVVSGEHHPMRLGGGFLPVKQKRRGGLAVSFLRGVGGDETLPDENCRTVIHLSCHWMLLDVTWGCTCQFRV